MLASVSTGRSDFVSLKATNFIFSAPASIEGLTFSTSALPDLAAGSNAVARTVITLLAVSIEMVAIALPAYIGRVIVPSSLKPMTSLATPASRRTATRGKRSFPTAVAVPSTTSHPLSAANLDSACE